MTSTQSTSSWLDSSAVRITLLCLALVFSGSLYAWSIFVNPLAARLAEVSGTEVTAADLSAAFSFAFLASPFGMFLSGQIKARLGLRAALLAAGAAIFAGLTGTALASSTAAAILAYGLFFGLGSGMIFCTAVSSVIASSPDRHKGAAGGAASMCWGLSAVLMAPAATWLTEAAGVQLALFILGALSGGFILLAAALLKDKAYSSGANAAAKASANETPWQKMLQTSDFYFMFAMMMLGGAGALMIFSRLAGLAQAQIGASLYQSSLAVSLLALASTSGRFIAALLSDRCGRLQTLSACFLLQAAGLGAMAASGDGDWLLFSSGSFAVGFCYGGLNGIYPSFMADRFGSRELAKNYAFINAACCLASFIGPALLLFSSEGGALTASYLAAVVCTLVSVLLGTMLFLSMRRRGGAR